MLRFLLASVLLFLFVVVHSNVAAIVAQEKSPAWAAAPIERAVSVRDGRTGAVLSWETMVAELAKADVVFLGETHLDETTHRVERAVFESLLDRRENKVVLSMEMFERDVQSHLDAYLSGETDEAAFLAQSRPWGNYRSAYRPLIEAAKNANAPVVAANFPTPVRRRMGRKGEEVFSKLNGKDRESVPKELIPNTKEYWERVDNAVRGHLAMMGGRSNDDSRLFSTQTLWDNAMGEACATALEENPGCSVLHINGGFHTAYWQGTARQLLLRKPEARVKTVSIVPSANPQLAKLAGVPVADYVVYAAAIASDVNEGMYSVSVTQNTRYKLSMPKNIPDGETVPLLIWLGSDGLNAGDGLDLWKKTFGDQVAIAVIEPRYKETQDDLSVGGRWYWPGTFAADIGASTTAVEKTWGYLLRNFPIDPERVCLAGEGSGGTVVAAITLRTRRMQVHGVAYHPTRYAKLKDFPLPLAKYWGKDSPPQRTLAVFGGKQTESFWAGEIEAYRGTHVDAEWNVVSQDPWAEKLRQENALRAALKLDLATAPENKRRYIVADRFSPRSLHWSRLQGLWHSDANVVAVTERPEGGHATELILPVEPSSFSGFGALPICPGSFGGTTVLVLPGDVTDGDAEQWIELEKNDPIARSRRFSRLRVATQTGDRSLNAVLERLLSENRKNILIVPAVVCADSNTMQAMKRSVVDFENAMTLQWLPGLGGRRALQED